MLRKWVLSNDTKIMWLWHITPIYATPSTMPSQAKIVITSMSNTRNYKCIGFSFFFICNQQVCGTIGTTSSCACDNLDELGETCSANGRDIWLHVDGAYGGNALICPEFRYLLRGFQVKNETPEYFLIVNIFLLHCAIISSVWLLFYFLYVSVCDVIQR